MSVQARRGRILETRGVTAIPLQGRAARDQGEVVTLEAGLYLGAVALGVALRLLLLNLRPLSIEEGALATESYRLWQGQPPEALHQGPLPAYGTALMLAMFAGGDAAARVLSALAGSLLLGVIYAMRHLLGRVPAVLAAYGIALSPVMLFASRDVGSGILPVVLALALWWALDAGIKGAGRWRAYAVALLLGGLLASGSEGITIGLALAVAGALSHPDPRSLLSDLRQASTVPVWRRAGLVFVGGALAMGTGLGTDLRGVQWVLVDSLTGWARSFSLDASRGEVLALLAMYELPVLALGVAQLIRTLRRRDRVDTFLSLWAMVLMLLSMLQGTASVSRVVLPSLPLYLLAARLVGDSIGVAGGAERGWRWAIAALVVTVPAMVGLVLLNYTATSGTQLQLSYWLGELAAAVVAVAVVGLLLPGRARLALAWWAGALVVGGFLLHSTLFLNFRLETTPREPLVGTQVSPFLRSALADGSYFANYFNARVTVDPQWRPTTEWYLRAVREVQYSTEQAQGISFQGAQAGQDKLDSGSERRPGTYTPTLSGKDFTWKNAWRWLVFRDGLVAPNQRDIIIRAPVGNY